MPAARAPGTQGEGPSCRAAAVVALAGAAACGALAASPPAEPGARVLLSASVLLGAFDTLVAVLAARPVSRRTSCDAAALWDAAALVAAAAPSHFAIAAAAGVPAGTGGFHIAWGAGLLGWSAAGLAVSHAGAPGDAPDDPGGSDGGGGGGGGGRRRVRVAVATMSAGIVCGLPLAAYAAAEFLGWRSRAPFLASPLTGPAFLAHDGAFATAADAVWPLAAAAVTTAVALIAGRRRGTQP